MQGYTNVYDYAVHVLTVIIISYCTCGIHILERFNTLYVNACCIYFVIYADRHVVYKRYVLCYIMHII